MNDTLFGYLIDKRLLGSKVTDRAIAFRRARIISYCGPFLAFTFLSAWFPHWLPGFPGLRFVTVLCSYDTVITLLDLMKGALLADLAVSQNDRSRLGSSASLGQALSAIGLVVISWWFNSGTDAYLFENPFNNIKSDFNVHALSYEFQALALFVAMFSAVGLFFSGRWLAEMTLRRSIQSSNEAHIVEQLSQNEVKQYHNGREVNDVHYMIISILQIVLRPNFFIFSLMQALQVFHCHFNSNFFPLFSKTLLGSGQEGLFCAILGISFVLPHINNVFLLRASETYGTYVVIRGLFYAKVVLGVILLFSGPSNIVILSVFLASNRIFTEGICKLLSQVISDLVDEDLVLSRRSQPVSALIFGATSLLGRPGQSFAPLVGYTLLSFLTGSSENPEINASTESLRAASFTLAWSLVIFVGLSQLAIWSRFGLHGDYLAKIKKARINIMDQPSSPSHSILSPPNQSLLYSTGGSFFPASRVICI
nr:transmembrane protein 180 [Hymenolepis microstoma]